MAKGAVRRKIGGECSGKKEKSGDRDKGGKVGKESEAKLPAQRAGGTPLSTAQPSFSPPERV